jgi:signal transduction histidine kinase/ActR/RegA family two-component response regulator
MENITTAKMKNPGGQPKVLIVDDEVSVRITIESILSSEQYELHFAENGIQALSMAKKIQPDIILLDVMMPGLNGFEVCQKIRSMPSLAEVPIVLITALDDREARMGGIKAGADDFISKPFSGQELRLRVQNMTRLSHYKRETLYSAIELKFYESFVGEQSTFGDQNVMQVHAISNIRDYVEADEALLVLFDLENPGLATKRLLRPGPIWEAEQTFFIKGSNLCSSMTQTVTMVNYDSILPRETDPVLDGAFTNPIRNIILAPLSVNKTMLGAMIFVNPLFEFKKDDRRARFLQLMIKGVSNAIFAVEHTRQLTISKAALEASQWEILNSRNTLRTFFDNIPSCIYVIDRSYNIMIINSRRSERVNKSPQKLVGSKCYESLYGNNAPCPLCRVADAFNGIPSVRSLREWQPKETFIQWEITTVPIRENFDTINQAIIFDEDVTEKWLLEANLIESEKLASIGQLAANVAHEINNPLSAIIANAQLMLRDLVDADEDTVEALKLIESAGVRAAKIVGDLLKSARREKRGEFEEISLNETILDALTMANFEIRNRSVTVELDLSEGMPNILAHQNQLKGVWINLIMNALGAIEGSQGVISISTHYENDEYRIAFSDNGKGIAAEHQEHIFEPFFTTKDASHGTGLGLSVSQQVIKEHHGAIDFESSPGKGTKFIIILPGSQKNGG